MTQEEKAKAYDNIIQRMTEPDETGTCLTMEHLFPKLRESNGKTKSAMYLIAEEREKQINKGFNWRHDDEHDCHQLSDAAIVYAAPAPLRYQVMNWWPWDKKWLKEDDSFTTEGRIRELVKAGALIVAEIERLQRTINNVANPIDSEDEKIRKYIIKFVELNKEVNLSPEDADRMLDWLEKQKGQNPASQKESKPVKWNKDDEEMLNRILYRLNDWDIIKTAQGFETDNRLPSPIKWLKNKLKSLREQ